MEDPQPAGRRAVQLNDLSNQQLFARYAAPGRVGLTGGSAFIDRTIRRVQRVGTLLALRQPALRGRENLLAREGALYCSAMVQHCYAQVGIDFCDGGVNLKNTTPQDIAGTSVPHTAYVVMRASGA